MIHQSDPSWVPARIGKLTASRMGDATNWIKDGKPGKDGVQKMKSGADRVRLLHELVAERVMMAKINHFVTPAMKDGIEREPDALALYEAATGNIVLPGGFVDHPTIEFFGATPDGLIDSSGLVQAKCPTPRVYLEWVMAGVVPAEHRPQMLAELAVMRRQWSDFCAYQPEFPPEKRIFVRRLVPTPEEIEWIETEAKQLLDEVEAMFGQLNFGAIAA